MADPGTRKKWDKAAATFDFMSGGGEKRWFPFKTRLFGHMQPGKILFAALGTGLDIPAFPPGMSITAIDISPEMLNAHNPVLISIREKLMPRTWISMICHTRTTTLTRYSRPVRSAPYLIPLPG